MTEKRIGEDFEFWCNQLLPKTRTKILKFLSTDKSILQELLELADDEVFMLCGYIEKFDGGGCSERTLNSDDNPPLKIKEHTIRFIDGSRISFNDRDLDVKPVFADRIEELYVQIRTQAKIDGFKNANDLIEHLFKAYMKNK